MDKLRKNLGFNISFGRLNTTIKIKKKNASILMPAYQSHLKPEKWTAT